MKTRKIWPAAALFAFLACVPGASWGQAKSEPSPPPPAKPAELAPDVAFARSIALIRGHLLTGDELVKQRQWSVASPHFNFPTEEIYGVIREDLRTYHTPPFDAALKALARTVKARNAAQYSKAMKKVETALATADAGLAAREPDWPRFTLVVAVEVLKAASDEYEDAADNGRIVHAVGYRSARGFILQAERMIETVAPQLPPGDDLAVIRAGFAQIKPAFAAMNAPDRAPIEEGALSGVIAQIEAAAEKIAPLAGRAQR